MDYSALSDFEVNSAVHNALMNDPYKLEFLENDRIRWTKKGSDVVTDKTAYGRNTLLDYCNKPADAWPIIVESGIGIAPSRKDPYAWDLSGGMLSGIRYSDKNPLRAAMIVFLMMQQD